MHHTEQCYEENILPKRENKKREMSPEPGEPKEITQAQRAVRALRERRRGLVGNFAGLLSQLGRPASLIPAAIHP